MNQVFKEGDPLGGKFRRSTLGFLIEVLHVYWFLQKNTFLHALIRGLHVYWFSEIFLPAWLFGSKISCFFAKLFKSYHFKPNFHHKINFLVQISLFVLKYSSLEPTFSLYGALIYLHIYCFKPHFPSYTFIWPYMIISFLQIFLPTRLFCPTLVLGTLE